MSRQRLVLFSLLTVLFVGVGMLYFTMVWRESTTRFRTGLPIPKHILPDELKTANDLIPQGPPQAPDIRPTDPVLSGNAQSPVTLIVFGDFECGVCKDQAVAIEESLAAIGNRNLVRVIWRDLPLINQHARAMSAATVAECAGRQGRFKQMHDLLFSQANTFSDDEYLSFMRRLNLNQEDFLVCLRDPAISFRLNGDIEDARKRAIGEVPTMFINGQPIAGYVDADTLTAILKREAQKASSNPS
ncbi:thioredoxin domain-containing protein [candidate division WWE3 bacterium]|uniref:Thioredoxin domain-containing protein n=1 Tax=candidate division WWE3 bacterium TaxID=2053526 RepID=A0A928TPW3_UNCKA|nr:thioredoxin domain-containing protein [candidate division WWE3 bacterium]